MATAVMTYQSMHQQQQPQFFTQQQQNAGHISRSNSVNGNVGPPNPAMHRPPPHQMSEQQRMQQEKMHHQYLQNQQRQNPQTHSGMPRLQRTTSNSHMANGRPGPSPAAAYAQLPNGHFPPGLSQAEMASMHQRRVQGEGQPYIDQQQRMMAEHHRQLAAGQQPPQVQQYMMPTNGPPMPNAYQNIPQALPPQRPAPGPQPHQYISRPPSQAAQYPPNNPPQLQLQNMTHHQQQAMHEARERQIAANNVMQPPHARVPSAHRPQPNPQSHPPYSSPVDSGPLQAMNGPVASSSTLPPRSTSLAPQSLVQNKGPINIFSANGIATMRLLQYTQALAEAMQAGMGGLKKFCGEFYTDKAAIKFVLTEEGTGTIREHGKWCRLCLS